MSTNPTPIPIPPGHATFSDLPRNVRVKLYSYLLISPNPVFYIQGCPRPCSNLTHRHSGNRFPEDELDIAVTDALVRRPRTYPNRPFKPPQAVYEASQILYSKNHFLVHGPGLLSFLNLDIISQDDEVFSTSRKWLQRITVICSTSSKKKVTHPDYWTPIPTLRALLDSPNLQNVTIKVEGREGDIFEALAMLLHIAKVFAELRRRLQDGFQVTMSHLHQEGGETWVVADMTWLFDSCSTAETETVKGTTGWKQILSTHLATTTVLRSDYRKCRTNESGVKSARRLLLTAYQLCLEEIASEKSSSMTHSSDDDQRRIAYCVRKIRDAWVLHNCMVDDEGGDWARLLKDECGSEVGRLLDFSIPFPMTDLKLWEVLELEMPRDQELKRYCERLGYMGPEAWPYLRHK